MDIVTMDMQSANDASSLPENNGMDAAHCVSDTAKKRWNPPKYYANCARVTFMLVTEVDRALEFEAVKRNITKRRLVELAICKELNMEPPAPPQAGHPKTSTTATT